MTEYYKELEDYNKKVRESYRSIIKTVGESGPFSSEEKTERAFSVIEMISDINQLDDEDFEFLKKTVSLLKLQWENEEPAYEEFFDEEVE